MSRSCPPMPSPCTTWTMRIRVRLTLRAAMRVVVITKIFPSSLEPLSAPFNLPADRGAGADAATSRSSRRYRTYPSRSSVSAPARAAQSRSAPGARAERGRCLTSPTVRQVWNVPRIGLAAAVPLYHRLAGPGHRNGSAPRTYCSATWAYPDGCAAVLAARASGKPCVVKVHGSDVTVVLQTRAARAVAARVLPLADAVIAVSRPLADEIVAGSSPRARASGAQRRRRVALSPARPQGHPPRARRRRRRAPGALRRAARAAEGDR